MPSYSYVEAPMSCPACGKVHTDMAAFQWGYAAGYSPREAHIYRIGDRIRWRICEGAVPRWAALDGDEGHAQNIGDPAQRDLYALDTLQTWLAGPCGRCGERSDGAAVEIRNGRIVHAGILPAGTLPFSAPSGLLAFAADGSLRAIPDEPMSNHRDCGPVIFWYA